MKILKMHLIEAAVAVLFVVLVFVLCHGDGEEVIEDMSYNQNWTSVVGGEKQEYEILPETVGLSYREEVVILRKKLPQDYQPADFIGYYTTHQLSEAYIDGKKVFERKIPGGARSKTPGNCWNFIRLCEGYAEIGRAHV